MTYPGAEVVIAAELAGKIISLPVREKSVVRKGDSIAELNSDELRASRDEAAARIDEAEAEIRFFDREVSANQRTHRPASRQRRRAGDQSAGPRHRARPSAGSDRLTTPLRRPHRQDADHRPHRRRDHRPLRPTRRDGRRAARRLVTIADLQAGPRRGRGRRVRHRRNCPGCRCQDLRRRDSRA